AAMPVVHRDIKPQNVPAPTSPVEKEEAMSFKEQVLAALAKKGNATALDLGETLSVTSTVASNTLRSLLQEGKVDRHGGHKGASWELGTGKSTRGEAPPPRAKSAKKPRTAKATNGHAAPAATSSNPMAQAMDLMRQAMLAEVEAKMAALSNIMGGGK
ncbi:MAG: hypothetical protein ACYDC2_03200, partial [Solirubrobacteraceae bacterium]